MKQFRNTKIVCTIGPACESEEMLRKLILAGMNVARLNFSHGDFEEHGGRIERIRKLNQELGTNVAILLDTKGPEIRTHKFENGGVTLFKDDIVRVTTDEVLGTTERFSITHPNLINDVKIGGKILVDDGNLTLDIIDLDFKNRDIICKVRNDAYIKDRRGINVPDIKLSLDFVSAKDKADIEFGCDMDVDFIAASFTRRAQDVIDIRQILINKGKPHIQIVSKIENSEGVENLEEIIAVSERIMVARGDLGVEVPTEEVPVIQRKIIHKCQMRNTVVITATQMLESMQKNPRPTRAEASDVANAVLAGTDAVMLSGETAAGKYPIEAVTMMANIAKRMEQEIDYSRMIDRAMMFREKDITSTIALAVAESSRQLDATAIITPTSSGYTAKTLSQYRPKAPIVALAPTAQVVRSLALNWGVHAVVVDLKQSFDGLLKQALSTATKEFDLQKGDTVIVTAGLPIGKSGSTNMMKIETIE